MKGKQDGGFFPSAVYGKAGLKTQKDMEKAMKEAAKKAKNETRSVPSPSEVPMPKTLKTLLMPYRGGSYVIHTGVRGGKYIMVNNNKVYLRK